MSIVKSSPTIKAVVTDIEGTTTAVSFVYETLFPYIRANMHEFLRKGSGSPDVDVILQEIKKTAKRPDATLEEVEGILASWMDQDLKITPLKALQGLMWEDGYKAGSYLGHVYEDAYLSLQNWKLAGAALYVYSSGSVKAQKLLFGNTAYGNLTSLFTNYFDTSIGGKKEASSYQKIIDNIALPANEVMFLSDVPAELDAAGEAGLCTVLVCRDGLAPQYSSHPVVKSFLEISL